MQIAELRVYVATKDLAGKVWNPKIRWLEKHSVFVEVQSDDGLVGLGEAWCFDRSPEPLVAFLASEVAPRLQGLEADPDLVARLLNDTTSLSARHGIMASALSAVDIALWDLAAQARGLPLWRHLGGSRGEAPVYASGGLYGLNKTAERLADELAGYIARGFRAVKMKVGALPPEEDATRVRKVREVLGPETDLLIDGVYSLTPAGARQFWDLVSPCRIAAFQSPIPADDFDGMAALTAAGLPLMGLEAEYRPDLVRHLVERPAVAILQLALVACGGISAARRFIALAGARGLPCSLEVSSSAVAELAALHLAAAHAQVISVEMHQVHDLLFDLVPSLAAPRPPGFVRLPDAPGLGMTLPGERATRRL
jgi:L-alanine-DL-glutamate epimerase-like enolase superfamily enzyme